MGIRDISTRRSSAKQGSLKADAAFLLSSQYRRHRRRRRSLPLSVVVQCFFVGDRISHGRREHREGIDHTRNNLCLCCDDTDCNFTFTLTDDINAKYKTQYGSSGTPSSLLLLLSVALFCGASCSLAKLGLFLASPHYIARPTLLEVLESSHGIFKILDYFNCSLTLLSKAGSIQK